MKTTTLIYKHLESFLCGQASRVEQLIGSSLSRGRFAFF